MRHPLWDLHLPDVRPRARRSPGRRGREKNSLNERKPSTGITHSLRSTLYARTYMSMAFDRRTRGGSLAAIRPNARLMPFRGNHRSVSLANRVDVISRPMQRKRRSERISRPGAMLPDRAFLGQRRTFTREAKRRPTVTSREFEPERGSQAPFSRDAQRRRERMALTKASASAPLATRTRIA